MDTGDVRGFAILCARLSEPEADREAILAENGLDEDAWEALDEAWQAQLSAEEDAAADDAGVPPLVLVYAEAFAAEQARLQATRAASRPVLAFEAFVKITQEMQRGDDPANLMKRHRLAVADFIAAERHWMKQMMNDAALWERFHAAVGGGGGAR